MSSVGLIATNMVLAYQQDNTIWKLCSRSDTAHLAFIRWARLDEVCSDGGDVGCDVTEPGDASDHNMQDVLPAVDVVIGTAEDIRNTLQRQKILVAFFESRF